MQADTANNTAKHSSNSNDSNVDEQNQPASAAQSGDVSAGLRELGDVKRVVVKIGSSLLTNDGRGLHREAFAGWALQLARLHRSRVEVILVSSGAVAEGVVRMGLDARPSSLHALQACAAVGQMGLIQAWSSEFMIHDIQTAQVLLTHEDLSNRERYLNTGEALAQMLKWQVIPVVNENDSIVIDEIRFGDNDTLGAMVASLVRADLYIMLTDQHGVFDDNPSENPSAKLIPEARAMDDTLFDVAGDGGKLGRGGMLTKIRAARLAALGGCPTVIAYGRTKNVVTRICAGESIGTLLISDNDRVAARKQWLAAHSQMAGTLVLDAGAIKAIRDHGRSLLPVGVQKVTGNFKAGDVVECVSEEGLRIAIGRVNFDAFEALKITQEELEGSERLFTDDMPEVMIHRDYLTLI